MIAKVRAIIQSVSFFNGNCMVNMKAIKIIHMEVKKPDYDYMEKMKRRQGDIRGFISEMNKIMVDQKKKKVKGLAEKVVESDKRIEEG